MTFFDLVDAASAKLFYTLSKWRRARIFHPRGTLYKGTLTITNTERLPSCVLFYTIGEYPVLVRLSRGVGLPPILPDILGFALRIPDLYGQHLHQDILMLTSGRGKITRYAMIFKYRFSSSCFSTILPYTIAGKNYLLGIIPSKEHMHDRNVFTLSVTSPFGEWQSVGTIRLEETLSEEESIQIRYTPWNTGDDIRPSGFLQRLRRHAYRASQQGRSEKEGDAI